MSSLRVIVSTDELAVDENHWNSSLARHLRQSALDYHPFRIVDLVDFDVNTLEDILVKQTLRLAAVAAV